MTEQHLENPKKYHPLVQLVFENPISTLNAVMIIFGGAGVYWTNDARMAAAEKDVTQLSSRLGRLENTSSNIIQREIGEVKTSIRGLETSVQFLVNAQRRRPNE